MPSKSSILALLALNLVACSALIGCAPRSSTTFKSQPTPKIQKGTKTTPQVSSQNDQILLAFNELGWARQNGALSVFPASVSSQEGCVIRRPMKTGYFLREDYSCKRASDESDSSPGQQRSLNGQNLFSVNSGIYNAVGSFSSEIWDVNTLVSRGDLTRMTQISIPGGAIGVTQASDVDMTSSVFKMTSTTDYRGQAAEDRDAEQMKAKVTSGFIFSASKPLTLLTGSQVSLTYLNETEKGAKRSGQVVQITALADISYVENGNCLRPVGSFSLSDGSTQVATLTTSAAGYSLSTETNVLHVWGKRCLER